MPSADDPRITLRVSQRLYDELRREATARDLSVSDVARRRLNGSEQQQPDFDVEDFERRLSRLEDLAGF